MLDEQLDDKREEINETRHYINDRQQRVHAVQLEVLKLSQAIERQREQRERLAEQLAELAEEEESEREREMAADDKMAEIRDGLARIRVLVAGAQSRLDEAERAVRAERERNADLDRALREAQFSLRECEGKLQDVFAQQATAQRELNRIEKDRAHCAEAGRGSAGRCHGRQPAERLICARKRKNAWPIAAMRWKKRPACCARWRSSA
jgi:chromosome segregation protein